MLFVACNTVHKTTDSHKTQSDSTAVHSYDSTKISTINKVETHEEANKYSNEVTVVLDSAGSTAVIYFADATSVTKDKGGVSVKGPAKINYNQKGEEKKKDSNSLSKFDTTGLKKGDTTQVKLHVEDDHHGKTSVRVPWLVIVGIVVVVCFMIALYYFLPKIKFNGRSK